MTKLADPISVNLEVTEAEALMVLRRRKGWSQEEAAKLLTKECGVDVPLWTLRGWEQGKHQPNKFATAALRKFIQKHNT